MALFFATSATHRTLTPDDHLAVRALAHAGLDARPLVWTATDPRAIPDASIIVIRSVWDYHLHVDEFLGWLSRVEEHGTILVNSADTIRWNIDKRYLLDLVRAGVTTIPTEWVQCGSETSLASVLAMRGWSRAVVKPAISASAHDTWQVSRRLDPASDPGDDSRFGELLVRRDVMVQPYVPAIETAGEWSVVFIGGDYSHAVIKRPAAGDFRVQEEYGGTREHSTPPPHVLSAARQAFAAIPGQLLFARIDGVETAGEFMLMEAECIDPALFFSCDERSPTRFADAIVARALDRDL